MKTIILDVLTPEDEEMVLTILEGLRKGNAIQFQSLDPAQPSNEVQDQILTSLGSPRRSWEEGMTQLGL